MNHPKVQNGSVDPRAKAERAIRAYAEQAVDGLPPVSAVDVGIPAYRRPRYIVEAIESVLAQTTDAWTLSISEDGGVGSGAVRDAVRPYLDDPRVTYRAMPERVGQSANWTSLIRSGSAPYVALLHDDDRWQPEFLARRVAFLEEHPECGLVSACAREIDEHGEPIGMFRYRLREGVLTPDELVPRLVRARANIIGHPPSILVRRAAYEAVGAVFRDVYWEDYDMWFRIAVKFPIGHVDVCDSDYRIHTDSLTGEAKQKRGEIRKAELQLAAERIAMVDAERPGLLTRRDRSELCADLALAIGLDELQTGHVRSSARYVGDAIRRYPRAVVDRRVPAWAVAVLLGSPGRRGLATARAAVKRRRGRRSR